MEPRVESRVLAALGGVACLMALGLEFSEYLNRSEEAVLLTAGLAFFALAQWSRRSN